MLQKILGVLFVLGALALAFYAYEDAGGMHGWRSFRSSRLNTAECAAAGILLVVGVGTMLRKRS